MAGIDIFGLVLAFSLILLGIVSKQLWFSIVAAALVILAFPSVDTVFWVLAAFVVGWVWNYGASEITENKYFFSVLLVAAAVLAFSFGQVVVGLFLAGAMLVSFLFSSVFKTGRKVNKRVKEEWNELKETVPKSKGSFPSGMEQLSTISTTVGAKSGETLSTTFNPKAHEDSNKLGERISAGAKNLLDALAKVFK